MTKQESTSKMPDPQQLAATYAEVAQRASKLLNDHMQRQLKHGVQPPTDELGVAQAFFDMASKMFANPYKVMQAQLGLVWDYYNLWQNSMMRMAGMSLAPLAQPRKGDNRFRDEQWENDFLFDFIKQSYLITARHVHDSVSAVEGMDATTKKKVDFFTTQFINALLGTASI